MNNLSNIEPKNVFAWFYEINQHPRESGNEKEISDFLVQFAKDRELEVYQDEIYNVIIKKPGTKGYENSEPVIIQGHMDMVCVKTEDSNHNFQTDPIEMLVEGDILRANKTTLGADDGIAVAYGLALLDSDEIAHPPIELLITTNEETGMDGVFALKKDHLTGTRLINLDTEEEGVLLVSCAGGSNIKTEFTIKRQPISDKTYEINISGLKGGHSGMEIHKQRANAIKILGRLLTTVKDKIILSSIAGGIKHNAIPSDATAVFSVKDFSEIENSLSTLANEIKKEYRVEEPNFNIEIKETNIKEVYTKELSNNIIDYLMIVPDGVQYMSKDIDGLVQTSLNNAIIGEENNKLQIIASVRSASSSSLREILTIIHSLAKRVNANTEEFAAYPAWEYESESKLRKIAADTFKEVYNKDIEISSIHAGLECGLLKKLLPDTDMISYGPAISGAHSPSESISISSVGRVWDFTKKLLENLN